MDRRSDIERVAAALAAGEAAVFPTDTVYGVGVAVGCASTPAALYAIKHRDPEKAIPWLVGGVDALNVYGKGVSVYALAAAQEFWPGPLTLIVEASPEVPKEFTAANGTIALRMPADATALDLIARAGAPLATSSANFQGKRPPHTFAEVDPGVLACVAAACGDEAPRSGKSSTIIDCTAPAPRLLREGAITLRDIEQLIS